MCKRIIRVTSRIFQWLGIHLSHYLAPDLVHAVFFYVIQSLRNKKLRLIAFKVFVYYIYKAKMNTGATSS